jgi:hypothetical protein
MKPTLLFFTALLLARLRISKVWKKCASARSKYWKLSV